MPNLPSNESVPPVSTAARLPVARRERPRLVSVVPTDGLLRSTFREEREATAFFRSNPVCLRELLTDAGFEDAADLPNDEHITNADIECSLPWGGLVMVELAYVLDRDHLWKDLQYIIDPRAEPRVAGFVWLCDEARPAALEDLEYWAGRLHLRGRVTLAVLRLKRLRRDRSEARFDVLTMLAGQANASPVVVAEGGLAHEAAAAAMNGTISSIALAKVLGTSPSWVTGRAHVVTNTHRPTLDCLPGRDGEPLPRRRMFALDDVIEWIGRTEAWIRTREKLAAPIPMVSGQDRRIGPTWLKLIDAKQLDGRAVSTESVRKRLAPAAFCIAPSDKGYTLLYPRDAIERLPVRKAPRRRKAA